MKYTSTIVINAPASAVWEVLANVAQWPSWTPTVESVRIEVADARLRVGQTVAIKQPKRKVSQYVVEEVADGSSFAWGSRSLGVRQWAGHEVAANGPGSCTVRLTFAFSGWIGSTLGALASGRIREMVDTEATSLKARLETLPLPPKR